MVKIPLPDKSGYLPLKMENKSYAIISSSCLCKSSRFQSLLITKSAIAIQALIFCLLGSEFSLSRRSCSWNFSKVTKSDALFLAIALSNLSFWSALTAKRIKSEFFLRLSTSQIVRIDSIIASLPFFLACRKSWSVI